MYLSMVRQVSRLTPPLRINSARRSISICTCHAPFRVQAAVSWSMQVSPIAWSTVPGTSVRRCRWVSESIAASFFFLISFPLEIAARCRLRNVRSRVPGPTSPHACGLPERTGGLLRVIVVHAAGRWALAACFACCASHVVLCLPSRALFRAGSVPGKRGLRVLLAAINRWVCRALGKLAATSLFFRRLSHVRRAIDGGPYDV